MDTQTRHAIKHDALVDSAQSAMGWFEDHKSEAILAAVLVLVLVGIIIGGSAFYQHREAEAADGFGVAMDIYNAPVTSPTTPAQPGVRSYPSSFARAQAAHQQFVQVADSFGSTDAGHQALYFAGLTEMEMGKIPQAEATLKKAAYHGDRNLAALANLALASIYRQSGRTSQAIDLLNRMAAHPTSTVPAAEAKLELGSIYETTDPAKAKQIYAELKDKDAKTAAGQIASEKLQKLH